MTYETAKFENFSNSFGKWRFKSAQIWDVFFILIDQRQDSSKSTPNFRLLPVNNHLQLEILSFLECFQRPVLLCF